MSPDEGNAVLSQSDIDALVSSSSEIGGETAESSTSPPPAADAAPAPAAANGDDLAEITKRLTQLEATVAKLSKRGGDAALAKQVKELSARMKEIRQNLPNTLGYGVHQTFRCPACSAQGTLAAHVMCTTCGGETAIGWWPPQAQ